MIKKNIGKLAIVMGMMVTVLAGCGSSTPEVEDILKDATSALKDLKSVKTEASFKYELEAKIKIDKKTQKSVVGMSFDVDGEYTKKPNIIHLEGTTNIWGPEGANDEEIEYETYFTKEDGEQIQYENSSLLNEWSKSEANEDSTYADSINEVVDVLKDNKKNLKLKKDGKVEKKDTYKLEGNIDADIFYEAIPALGIIEGDEKDSALSEFDFSKYKAKVTVEFYQESKLPAKITIDLKDAFKEMMDYKGTASTDATLKANDYAISIVYKDYNNKDEIKLPKKFKDLKTGDKSSFKSTDGKESAEGPWTSLSFTLEGNEVKLPVDYAVLRDAGWVIDKNSEADLILNAKEVNYGITLVKGEMTLRAMFYNPTDGKLKVSDSQIISIDVQDYSSEGLDFVAPGEVKIGMSEADLNKAYPEFSRKTEYEFGNTYYYKNDKLGYQASVTIGVDKDGKVSSIEIDATPEDIEFY